MKKFPFLLRNIAMASALLLPSFWASVVAEPTASPAGAPPPLAPHRAVYELTLLSSKGSAGPSAANGSISFDFSGNKCDGYIQNFTQTTEIVPIDGVTQTTRMNAATFEDGQGRTFRFKVESGADAAKREQIDGQATKSEDGGLSISLQRPNNAKIDLDKGILFPTEHINRILEAARENRSILIAQTFDGSDTGQKIYDATAVIGKERIGDVPEKAAQIPELKSMRRWPLTISYFDVGKKDSTPYYVMSFDLYENGVSRDLKLDYGDFVLKGEIKELELTPSKSCS